MHKAGGAKGLNGCLITFIYVTGVYVVSRKHMYTAASWMLVFFYLMLASYTTWNWGINASIGPLIFGVAIVLAGIVLTAKHALLIGALSALMLFVIQHAAASNWHQSGAAMATHEPSIWNVVAYCTAFCMLALVSWLYKREVDRSLNNARQAEAALQQQKVLLKKQVKERTKELQKIQLEEMRQMYHFAELGQLGVTLLHDLAGHLSALTLEIEDIGDKRDPHEVARAQEITAYLNKIVDGTSERLYGETRAEVFDVIRVTNETIKFLGYKAVQNSVVIDWKPPDETWRLKGDPTSFAQIIAILTNNAIDAYGELPLSTQRRVVVTIERDKTKIIIRISDWGKGIRKGQRAQLFKPHHSSKKSGLGLGLYIAKQTTEMLFDGTILLNPKSTNTEFIVKLPLNISNQKGADI